MLYFLEDLFDDPEIWSFLVPNVLSISSLELRILIWFIPGLKGCTDKFFVLKTLQFFKTFYVMFFGSPIFLLTTEETAEPAVLGIIS